MLGLRLNRVQHGLHSVPPEPPVTPEFDTVDFDDIDFETGETT